MKGSFSKFMIDCCSPLEPVIKEIFSNLIIFITYYVINKGIGNTFSNTKFTSFALVKINLSVCFNRYKQHMCKAMSVARNFFGGKNCGKRLKLLVRGLTRVP